MSEVKHYFWVQDGMSEGGRSLDTYVKSPVFDRVTAELVSANSDKEAYAQNAIDLRKRVDALQTLLTAADERADVLVTALSKIKLRLDAFVEAERDMPSPSVEVCQSIAYAALKPAEAAKCARCDCSTVEACDERGCGFLGSGNGAP